MDKYQFLASSIGGNAFWYDSDNPFVGSERNQEIRGDIAALLEKHDTLLNPKKVGTLVLKSPTPIGDSVYHPGSDADVFYAYKLDKPHHCSPVHSKFVCTSVRKPVYCIVLTLNYWQGKIIISRAQYGKLPYAEPVDILSVSATVSLQYWRRVQSFWSTHALNPGQVLYNPDSVTRIIPVEWDFEKLRLDKYVVVTR